MKLSTVFLSIFRNFKNVAKTLAARHQHYMCYQMSDSKTSLRHQTTYTGSQYFFYEASVVTIKDTGFQSEILQSAPELCDDSVVEVCISYIIG